MKQSLQITHVQALVALLGAAIAVPLVMAGALLLAPLVGAFAGLIFGWVFPETAIAILVALNLQTISFWQFGAAVAFIGTFFRTPTAKKA